MMAPAVSPATGTVTDRARCWEPLAGWRSRCRGRGSTPRRARRRRSKALRAYQRRTKQADSLIAGGYLAGTNTRRVRRALAAVFGGAVSKSLPSRRRGIREFLRKWRLKCKAVADSLEEAGDRLFTFTRLPSSRTTNAIERLHEEFKRRIKTQTVPPSAETAAMLFWALLASGQINMRKVDGWQSLTHKLADKPIDLAA
jgi:transposase-like protein